MYSYEIDRLLKIKNYLLSVKEYQSISDIKSNPQINHIKYDCYNDTFEINTKDNYNFKFKVKRY